MKEAVKKAMKEHPIIDDPKFDAVRRATIGSPLTVKGADGKDEHWFVPLLIGKKANGYAQVERNLKVSQLAIFGANSEDRGSWIDASFFEKPPLEAINSIRARYPQLEMSDSFFSYDQNPAKWGWKVKLKDKHQITVFITPSGWHELPKHKPGYEG